MTTKPAQPLILFADDHRDTRTMYSDFFEANGFRTAKAADGLAAIALAEMIRPDVIVLDIHMPRLDGIATLKLLRRHHQLRDTPVLVLTSYDFYETDALSAGATAVCVKPCAPDKLLGEVRTWLSRRRSP